MIGVIGDTHMGAGYNMGNIDPKTQLNTRLLDFSNTFDQIIDTFSKRNVKTIILTGDIFETRHPTSAQLNAFSKCIRRAINLGMEIIISVGNHDQQRNISTTTVDVFEALKLPFLKIYQEISVHKTGDLNIILMPYRDRRMMNASSNSEAIEMLKDELNNITESLTGKKVVVGHFMLEKSPEGFDPDMFSLNELILPMDMFKQCDVVIMGHIHKYEMVSSSLNNPTIIYSGSMDRVTFGEKDHKKVSLILDPKDIHNVEVIESNVRNLFEINLDYVDKKNSFKEEINNIIMSGIDDFNKNYPIKNSIVKIIIRVKENDLYYVKQPLIKEYVLSRGVKYCASIQVTSINTRQLRNSTINETQSGKKAFASYLNGIKCESEAMKKKLLKCAEEIIEEVEVK
jgi:DNA repair exonuclease SbcCD nuclease subunit